MGYWQLDDLLYFFPGPYAMLSAYLDESGTHGEAPIMCVAGLLYTADAVKRLDQEWKEELEPIFRMPREAFPGNYRRASSSHGSPYAVPSTPSNSSTCAAALGNSS